MKFLVDNLSYVDFRVLAILLALMIIVAGIKSTGFFEVAVNKLLAITHTTRELTLYLTLACFFVSMLMTNDVALITFVPFAIMAIEKAGKEKILIRTVVFQTIGANLGSMLTPIGNPQNLYLYSKSGMGIGSFLVITIPYVVVSFVLLLLCCMLLIKKESIQIEANQSTVKVDVKQVVIYTVLFVLAIASVLHVVDYRIMLVVVIIVSIIMKPSLIGEADYKLLLTFVVLFLLIGNVKNISVVSDFIGKYVNNREVIWGVILSQGISNVPAAMLLSGFTTNYKALIVGTNLGGLGTLIASMASLISYKAYVSTKDSQKIKYIIEFSVFNICFLIILLLTGTMF